MDEQLFEAFQDASMDAPGIDWNAFERRRKKKKRRMILWLCFAGLILSGVAVTLFIEGQSGSLKYDRAGVELKEDPENESMNNSQSPNVVLTPEASIAEKKEKVTVTEKVNVSAKGKKESSRKVLNPSRVSTPNIESQSIEVDKAAETGSITYEIPVESRSPQIIEEGSGLMPSGLQKFPYEYPSLENTIKGVKKLQASTIKLSNIFLQFQAGPSVNFPQFRVSELGKAFIHKDYAGIRKNSESGLAGYGFQATAGVSIKKLDLSMGLGLSGTRVYGNYDFVYSEKPIFNPDGSIVSYNTTSPSLVRFNSSQNYTFVEFPLYIDYTIFSKNKMRTSLHFGMVNQFLKGISGELPNALFMDRKDKLSPENFKSYSANLELGFRFSHQFNRRLQLAISPVYRKNFGFHQVQSYYTNKFNTIGLQFSIRTYL
jgi:hypothetical protein